MKVNFSGIHIIPVIIIVITISITTTNISIFPLILGNKALQVQ